ESPLAGSRSVSGKDNRILCRSRKRAVDHVDRIRESVHRQERTESRTFLLAQKHLIEHVEPIERHAGLAVLGLALAALVQERLASGHFLYPTPASLGRAPCVRVCSR